MKKGEEFKVPHHASVTATYDGNLPLMTAICCNLLLFPTASLIVTDLEILVVLVTRLLKQDLDRLVNGMEPVEPWDEG